MLVVYSGEHAEVEVPEAGDLRVTRDVPVEVPNDVGGRLIQQGPWKRKNGNGNGNGKGGKK